MQPPSRHEALLRRLHGTRLPQREGCGAGTLRPRRRRGQKLASRGGLDRLKQDAQAGAGFDAVVRESDSRAARQILFDNLKPAFDFQRDPPCRDLETLALPLTLELAFLLQRSHSEPAEGSKRNHDRRRERVQAREGWERASRLLYGRRASPHHRFVTKASRGADVLRRNLPDAFMTQA